MSEPKKTHRPTPEAVLKMTEAELEQLRQTFWRQLNDPTILVMDRDDLLAFLAEIRTSEEEPTEKEEAKNVIAVDYVYIKRRIEIDFEAKLKYSLVFYREHKIKLPKDFEKTMREIWEENQKSILRYIQKFGFDEILLIPGGLDLSRLESKMTEGYYGTSTPEPLAEMRDNSAKDRIVLIHKKDARNLFGHFLLTKTIGLSHEELKEKFGRLTHLSLADYLIFQRQYFEKYALHLDDKDMCVRLLDSETSSEVKIDVSFEADEEDNNLKIDELFDEDNWFAIHGCRLCRRFFKREKK